MGRRLHFPVEGGGRKVCSDSTVTREYEARYSFSLRGIDCESSGIGGKSKASRIESVKQQERGWLKPGPADWILKVESYPHPFLALINSGIKSSSYMYTVSCRVFVTADSCDY